MQQSGLPLTPQAQPFAQPFAQPSQAPPLAHPMAYPPQAQVGAQTFQQAFAPAQQPFAQPFAPMQQPHPQQMHGYPGQLQQQPAPIAPVPNPALAAPVTQGQQNGQQSPQQAFGRQLVGVARNLEQMIPSYQLMIAGLEDLHNARTSPAHAGAPALIESLKEATFHHFATLGAIRRFLCGEASSEVVLALAVGLHRLMKVHSQARPQIERVMLNTMGDARSPLSSLGQALTAADSQLSQASNTIQSHLNPQIWEVARARAFAPLGDEVPADLKP